jgi:hypothetical protein
MSDKERRLCNHVARAAERRGVFNVLVGNPEGKRPLGRPKRRWEDILRWIFRKWNGGMDWIDLTRDRDRWWALVNAVINVPETAGNFLTS